MTPQHSISHILMILWKAPVVRCHFLERGHSQFYSVETNVTARSYGTVSDTLLEKFVRGTSHLSYVERVTQIGEDGESKC